MPNMAETISSVRHPEGPPLSRSPVNGPSKPWEREPELAAMLWKKSQERLMKEVLNLIEQFGLLVMNSEGLCVPCTGATLRLNVCFSYCTGRTAKRSYGLGSTSRTWSKTKKRLQMVPTFRCRRLSSQLLLAKLLSKTFPPGRADFSNDWMPMRETMLPPPDCRWETGRNSNQDTRSCGL